jgi:hypothetical protein
MGVVEKMLKAVPAAALGVVEDDEVPAAVVEAVVGRSKAGLFQGERLAGKRRVCIAEAPVEVDVVIAERVTDGELAVLGHQLAVDGPLRAGAGFGCPEGVGDDVAGVEDEFGRVGI